MAQMKLFAGWRTRKRKLAVGGAGDLDLPDDIDLDYDDKVRVVIDGRVVKATGHVTKGDSGEGRTLLDASFSISTDDYSIEKL